MKYIIKNVLLGQITKSEEGKFICNPTITIGIEGDKFGLSLSTGCTVDISEATGTPAEVEKFIIAEAQKFVDNTYNK